MAKKIIIAGGGTGGHIFPALAIANALKREDPATEILFVGARGKMEMEKVPQAGFPIRGLDIAGFNRSSLLKNIGLPFKLLKSFLQVRSILTDFRPDAAIGVGGYSSFPVLRMAQARGIPTFLHEANSFAGKSNQLLARKAQIVFTGTEGMEKFFPAGKIVVSGNPIRPAILKTAELSKAEALRFFGLQEGKVTVLAVGGSLGARSINEALAGKLNELFDAGIQLIWQTGKVEAARWKQAADGKPGVWVDEFINQMEKAYAAADIVVARAGAMSVAELCVVARPVVFVPFPFAAEDHQTANARTLVNANAALLVPDAEARERVVPELLALAADAARRETYQHNIARFGTTDADRVIAKAILKQIA